MSSTNQARVDSKESANKEKNIVESVDPSGKKRVESKIAKKSEEIAEVLPRAS